MRISRPRALLGKRLRHHLRLRHLRQRTKLIIIFCSLLMVLAAGYMWWYLPHRPSALASQAVLASFRQPSTSFRLATGGSSSLSLDGQIDKDGDSDINFVKNGQRLGLRTVGDAAYIKGADGQWLSLPPAAAKSLLPSLPVSGIQSDELAQVNRKQLEKLYRQHPFMVVNVVFKDETVAGVPSNHYQLAVNKPELRQFLVAVRHDMPKLGLQESQIDSILSASLIGQPIGIWVGIDDGLVHQVAFANGGAETTITFMTYGQTADITKPQAAQDLMTTLQR